MSGSSTAQPGSNGGGDSEHTGDALTLLTQGKRHLLVKDYSEAVSSLGQACALLAAKYGETADECGEAFLFYGKALLELARTESGVLGDAIEGEDSDEDSDEEDAEESSKDKEGNDVKSEAEETETDKDDNSAPEEEKANDSAAESKEGKEQEEEEEDVSNLKLSWEMLELAKIIFQRQAKKDTQMNLKLAEVFLNLGEVSLESEAYDQAIQDLQSGLGIQKEHLEEDDRRIAETYYRLGMAHSLFNEFDEAVQQYLNAQELLELRVKKLEEKRASGDKPEETDAFYTIEGEIEELKGIIPDVRDKVSELKGMKAETVKAVSEMIKDSSGAGSSKDVDSKPKPAEAKPASNISHLVRKKQKADEVGVTDPAKSTDGDIPSPEAVPAKMQKSE